MNPRRQERKKNTQGETKSVGSGAFLACVPGLQEGDWAGGGKRGRPLVRVSFPRPDFTWRRSSALGSQPGLGAGGPKLLPEFTSCLSFLGGFPVPRGGQYLSLRAVRGTNRSS